MIEPFVGDITFPVDDQIRGEVAWKEWMITTRIDTADYCRTAWKAIHCHQTQLASLGALAEMHEDAAVAILAMQKKTVAFKATVFFLSHILLHRKLQRHFINFT